MFNYRSNKIQCTKCKKPLNGIENYGSDNFPFCFACTPTLNPVPIFHKENLSPLSFPELETFYIQKHPDTLFVPVYFFFDKHFDDNDKKTILYVRDKLFRVRNEFSFYSDEKRTDEVLWVKRGGIQDLSPKYELHRSGEPSLHAIFRRNTFKSFFRTDWTIFDDKNNEIGHIKESCRKKPLYQQINPAYYLFNPKKYFLEINNNVIAEFQNTRNFVNTEIEVKVHCYDSCKELIIAAGVLLAGVERNRKNR